MTTIPAPACPCESCLNDPACRAFGQDGALIAVFCHHNSAGGTYRPAAGIWTVISPIDFDGFSDYCTRLGALHVKLVAAEDGIQPANDLN